MRAVHLPINGSGVPTLGNGRDPRERKMVQLANSPNVGFVASKKIGIASRSSALLRLSTPVRVSPGAAEQVGSHTSRELKRTSVFVIIVHQRSYEER